MLGDCSRRSPPPGRSIARSRQRRTGPQCLAASASAEVVPDPATRATSRRPWTDRRAENEGSDCVVLLPGDCRCSTRASSTAFSPASRRPPWRSSPTATARDDALVLAPPAAIRPAFGEGSCARHVAAAREADVPFWVEELHARPRPRRPRRPRRPEQGDRRPRARGGAAHSEGARDMSAGSRSTR